MIRYLSWRVLAVLPVLLVVMSLTFFLLRAIPGGPFDQERSAAPGAQAQIEAYYHLNDPLWQQYGDYLERLLQGDLGPSFRHPGRSVNEMIATGFPLTLQLAGSALLFAVLLGFISGVLAAQRPGSWVDYSCMGMVLLGISVPTFVMGPLLMLVFVVGLGWFPVAGWGQSPWDWVLPTLTLGLPYAAYTARLTRGGLLETLGQDFIRTARAKGLPEWRIVLVHALRGALLPVVAFAGPTVAGLLTGSFVVETLYQIPGIGRFYVQAAFNRDYTLVMGMTLVLAALTLLCNLLADLLLAWLEPRVRNAEYSR